MIEVIFMMVNTNAMVSISEANQNFSRIARMVDEKGSVIIMKNNAPRYLVIDFPTSEQGVSTARTEEVLSAASKFMDMYDEAFKELAK